MDKWILRDAERYASAHRRKQRWYQVMTCLAAVVVFCTTYALILPAITLEKQCQIPEHTHTDSCYTQVTSREKSVLACEVEADAVIHKHDAACRDENGNLVCSLPELEAHRHTDSCYTIPEVHAHTDACYTRERGELTCTQSTEPRHTHTEACYQESSDLVCGMPESTGHTHGADCYDNDGNPICGQEESQGHTHGEGCSQVPRQLICGQTEEPAHQHTDECYSWNQVLTCGQSTEAAQPVLTCEKDEIELHTHQPFVSEEDRGCYDAEGKNLVCGKPQVVEHQHTGACFKTVTEAVDTETLTCTLPEDETHTHTTLCYGTWELTCGLEEHTHSPACGSDPGADLETADIWEQTFAEVELTGDWQQDVLAIAGTQLGYTESTANYIVEDDGQTLRGYTRYGAWYGDPYGDWDAMFVSFCLHYAGVDEKFPLKADSASWVQALSDEECDLYIPAPESDPWPGDLIFFNREPELEEDAEPVADHVGLVAEVIPEEGDRPAQIKVIEGDASAEDGSPDAVRCVTYELDDETILGYAVIPANPEDEGAFLTSNNTLYLDTSQHTDWESGGAVTGLRYTSNNTEKIVKLNPVAGREHLFSVTVTDMDPGTTFQFIRAQNDTWGPIWNHTENLGQPQAGNCCYYLTGWSGELANGHWGATPTIGSGSTVTTLYLDLSQFTTDGGWEKDGATFYLKYYNTSGNETSVRLTKKENEPYYSVAIPADMDRTKSLQFERRNPEGSEVLHHTSDLTLPTNGSNRYIITDWTEGHWYGQGTGETRTVYYDATLSKLSYNGDWGTNTIPMANGNSEGDKVYCHWRNSTSEGNVQMTRDHDDVYWADIPTDTIKVLFYSSSDGNVPDGGSNMTEDQVIPNALKSPCFYGDTSDSVIYDNAKRSGYWGEVDTIRDAGAGKNRTVVDIAGGTQTKSNDVLYVNTTLYDYYTDYELNGNNRDGYAKDGFDWKNSHRVYQPFRQFNQALSAYYQQNAASHPLYWGNFQNYSGSHYNTISATLNLYGYDNNTNRFFAENNSMWGYDGKDVGNEGKQATQGLVDSTLSGGTLTMGGNAAPFFSESFLSGSNAKNTVLGKVYHNVSFPFVKQDMKNNGVDYWCFDSSKTNMANSNLQLQQDGSRYFLQPTNDPVNGYSTDSTAGPGYFPFNTSAQSGQEPRLNYGFGQRFDIQFRLTEDGTVTANNNQKVPVEFNFSGDDDVWVFVDGQLVLDIGGDHGRVEGSINFKDRNSTVSRVKNSGSGTTAPMKADFPQALQGSDFYSSEHTLTMFYMERGLWESNMEITFNFPDENALVVEKNVDTKNVNNLFSGLFNDVPFTFNIKTMATHYGTTSGSSAGSGVGFMSQNEIPDYGTAGSGVLAVPKGATYITSSNSNEKKTIGDKGSFTLKNGERAIFQDQFRRGSYMYLEEDANPLYTTTWSMYEGVSEAPVETSAVPSGSKTVSDGGQSMTGFGSYVVTDGRTEIQGPLAGDDDDTSAHGENKYRDGNASVPENAFVFRHYSNPDSTIGTTKLTVKFTNTVKTGSLTITKAQAEGSEDLGTQEFTFYVTFRNVGGKNLEETASIQTDSFTLKVGDSKTIEGIPVGTEFIIHEVKPEGGEIVLDNVNGISPGTGTVNDSATYTVTGSIPADGTEQSYTFYNSKLPTVSLTVQKEWKTAMGATMIQGLPQSIKVRLQRSSDGNIWETVSGYAVVTLTPEDSTRWDSYSYTFQNLPRYTNSTGYRYRVVELDSSEYEVDGSVTIGDKVFTVTYSDVINSSENGAPPAYSQTITNKEQPTGYELPDTGGTGTIPYTIGGSVLITFTAFLLLYNQIRRRKEDAVSS